jgi:hypothetical protein
MKLNPKFKLRQVGKKFMVVDADTGSSRMTNVYTFNASAAMLWQRIGTDSFVPEDLALWLCEAYDVDLSTARADVNMLLSCWIDGGLVLNE